MDYIPHIGEILIFRGHPFFLSFLLIFKLGVTKKNEEMSIELLDTKLVDDTMKQETFLSLGRKGIDVEGYQVYVDISSDKKNFSIAACFYQVVFFYKIIQIAAVINAHKHKLS